MRLGLISDVHANVLALGAVLEALEEAHVDQVLCLGDLVGYGPAPNETIELLRATNVQCILGSADERIAYPFVCEKAHRNGVGDLTLDWTLKVIAPENISFLRQLPPQLRLETPAGRLRLLHTSAEAASRYLEPGESHVELIKLLRKHRCKILACGGSHMPYTREVAGGCFVNPGSVGLSLNGEPGADYAVLDIHRSKVKVSLGKASYDVGAVAFDIISWGLPERVAETVRRGKF